MEFVDRTITENKVLVWSLQYCEFCWTLRKLLDATKVDYKLVSIDALEFAKDNMGRKYRSALSEKTGCGM